MSQAGGDELQIENEGAESGEGDLGFQVVIGLAFVAVLAPAVFFVARLGAASARQFLIDGGDSGEGARLGFAFAALVAVLCLGTGVLCLLPLRAGGYALPGWVGQLLVAILLLLSLVLLFLLAIGGMGGPPTDTSLAREYARALYGWFPMIPILGVIIATEAALIWRTVRDVQAVSAWRMPVILSAAVTAVTIVLVSVAVTLN